MAMNPDPASSPLTSIKHIVVLMMENRSFDHMLGYLGLDGGIPGVDGLQHAEANYYPEDTPHPIHPFGAGETAFHPPGKEFDESLDPCHSPKCVEEQLSEYRKVKPGGFVKNFVERKDPPPEWRGLPMGYFTAEHLPVYDFLAHRYCVCDAWHSSIPGDTWPNRLYSLAGREGDKVRLSLLERAAELFGRKLSNVPIYDVEAFTRQLHETQWRWYSDDPATLRGADKRYRRLDHLRRENFAFFDRKQIHPVARFAEKAITAKESFLDDAAKGKLPHVSWIDPNFVNLHVLHSISNDDHPPADILAGQQLVLELYDALSKTADWNDTLLVVCYDEHGGFYDHVDPPQVKAGDGSKYPTYGVRVPALVVGPRVKREVCHELFDHTSLIKTILLRFAADPRHALAQMPPRVQAAQDLSVVLQDQPRGVDSHEHLHATMDDWRNRAHAARRASDTATPSRAPDGAGHELKLTDYQSEFVRFAHAINRLDRRARPWQRMRRTEPPPPPQQSEQPPPSPMPAGEDQGGGVPA
jgi:phospholipase C